ncbi:sigma-70 family RNA polymerase sigma factor [Cytobacillus massiliigabonensis]|uniref:sigma-70 family RNA polymerase sigma factor n=1 Tax=Cytobacillus massiliigabonensis TaxID=1871011 RepID=UPI000C865D48|nr:sigma-70 family RNA polymerase sigma factor [Cytobacillus massiliigabonensis]
MRRLEQRDELFESIVHDYLNEIRKLIYSYVKNHHTMEEITQEVFLTAFQKIGEFRGDSSLKTWLYTIAINKSKDYLKSWHYRYMSFNQFFQDRGSVKSVEEELISVQRNRELAKVIMALPVKYREIIILYYYHDLDSNEISILLNLNVSTVRTRLTRGRDLIKRRFNIEWTH